MNNTEAMIYCLGFKDDKPEDGAFYSQVVYDRNDEPHWFAFDEHENYPRMCSGSCGPPFSERLGPYRMFKRAERA